MPVVLCWTEVEEDIIGRLVSTVIKFVKTEVLEAVSVSVFDAIHVYNHFRPVSRQF